ncbi:hypothetical protein [Halocynthiibacter sp.]|uniref:hypothetical protein n=1 Tax=Halocynthiibacter sp. TaxID=1979210 RepID=UPI003C5C6BDF
MSPEFLLIALIVVCALGSGVIYGVFASFERHKVLESPRARAWIRRAFAASFAGSGLNFAFEKA